MGSCLSQEPFFADDGEPQNRKPMCRQEFLTGWNKRCLRSVSEDFLQVLQRWGSLGDVNWMLQWQESGNAEVGAQNR